MSPRSRMHLAKKCRVGPKTQLYFGTVDPIGSTPLPPFPASPYPEPRCRRLLPSRSSPRPSSSLFKRISNERKAIYLSIGWAAMRMLGGGGGGRRNKQMSNRCQYGSATMRGRRTQTDGDALASHNIMRRLPTNIP